MSKPKRRSGGDGGSSGRIHDHQSALSSSSNGPSSSSSSGRKSKKVRMLAKQQQLEAGGGQRDGGVGGSIPAHSSSNKHSVGGVGSGDHVKYDKYGDAISSKSHGHKSSKEKRRDKHSRRSGGSSSSAAPQHSGSSKEKEKEGKNGDRDNHGDSVISRSHSSLSHNKASSDANNSHFDNSSPIPTVTIDPMTLARGMTARSVGACVSHVIPLLSADDISKDLNLMEAYGNACTVYAQKYFAYRNPDLCRLMDPSLGTAAAASSSDGSAIPNGLLPIGAGVIPPGAQLVYVGMPTGTPNSAASNRGDRNDSKSSADGSKDQMQAGSSDRASQQSPFATSDGTSNQQAPFAAIPVMPVRIDPEEEKRIAQLRQKIALLEHERENIEGQYVSLRAHYVRECQLLEHTKSDLGWTNEFLQELVKRRGKVLALRRVRCQIVRDVLACLKWRRMNEDENDSNDSKKDEDGNVVMGEKEEKGIEVDEETAETFVQIWDNVEEALREAELACQKMEVPMGFIERTKAAEVKTKEPKGNISSKNNKSKNNNDSNAEDAVEKEKPAKRKYKRRIPDEKKNEGGVDKDPSSKISTSDNVPDSAPSTTTNDAEMKDESKDTTPTNNSTSSTKTSEDDVTMEPSNDTDDTKTTNTKNTPTSIDDSSTKSSKLNSSEKDDVTTTEPTKENTKTTTPAPTPTPTTASTSKKQQQQNKRLEKMAIPWTSSSLPRTPHGIPLRVSVLSNYPDRIVGGGYGSFAGSDKNAIAYTTPFGYVHNTSSPPSKSSNAQDPARPNEDHVDGTAPLPRNYQSQMAEVSELKLLQEEVHDLTMMINRERLMNEQLQRSAVSRKRRSDEMCSAMALLRSETDSVLTRHNILLHTEEARMRASAAHVPDEEEEEEEEHTGMEDESVDSGEEENTMAEDVDDGEPIDDGEPLDEEDMMQEEDADVNDGTQVVEEEEEEEEEDDDDSRKNVVTLGASDDADASSDDGEEDGEILEEDIAQEGDDDTSQQNIASQDTDDNDPDDDEEENEEEEDEESDEELVPKKPAIATSGRTRIRLRGPAAAAAAAAAAVRSESEPEEGEITEDGEIREEEEDEEEDDDGDDDANSAPPRSRLQDHSADEEDDEDDDDPDEDDDEEGEIRESLDVAGPRKSATNESINSSPTKSSTWRNDDSEEDGEEDDEQEDGELLEDGEEEEETETASQISSTAGEDDSTSQKREPAAAQRRSSSPLSSQKRRRRM
eukprot:CAMPEP_0195512066 /NCGR_PEP_ID=MMETSP0794_2-20130614/4165_1 /TAXON_ID=515487 /ORGANISM="Stephanopyxis turris, Strain CCMP 815" /LENGTH=1230 /DNA_ID=CAMNT_0040639787 /DNA_START=96 /DNA_END=3788 /DNA_ORIENTATION=+